MPAGQSTEPPGKPRPTHLKVIFVKTASMAFEIQRQDEGGEKSILAEQKKISRNFIPFVTSPAPGTTYSGVFFTGDRPNWILAGNKSGVQIYPSGHSVVHAFTACSLWDSRGDFLLYTEEVGAMSSRTVVHSDTDALTVCYRVLTCLNGCRISSWTDHCRVVPYREDGPTLMFCLIRQRP